MRDRSSFVSTNSLTRGEKPGMVRYHHTLAFKETYAMKLEIGPLTVYAPYSLLPEYLIAPPWTTTF